MSGYVVAGILISSVELVSVYEMSKQLSKEKLRIFVMLIVAVAYLSFSIINSLQSINMLAGLLINVLMLFAFTYIYKINIYKRVLSVLIFVVMTVLMEYLGTLIVSYTVGIPVSEFQNDVAIYTLASITTKFSIFVIIKILFKFILVKGTLKDHKYSALNLVMPLSTLVALFAITVMSFYTESDIAKIISIVSVLLLIISNISAFLIYEYGVSSSIQAEKNKYEKLLIEKDQNELQKLISSQIVANKEIHEVKNKMFSLREMIDSNKAEAIELASEFCNIYQNKELLEYTKIGDVDILLNSKKYIAKEKNIDIKYKISIQDTITVESIDLCICLGNMLDNAIEHSIEGKVLFSIMADDNYISIKSENKFDTTKIITGGTSKENKGLMHGYGLSKLNEIADKYSGNFTTLIDGEVYKSMMLLKI